MNLQPEQDIMRLLIGLEGYSSWFLLSENLNDTKWTKLSPKNHMRIFVDIFNKIETFTYGPV
jgi:hypothetical protein